MLLRNINHKIQLAPSQPSFCQQEDLGTSNHDALSLECSCADSSFLEPEQPKETGYIMRFTDHYSNKLLNEAAFHLKTTKLLQHQGPSSTVFAHLIDC